MIEIFLFLSLLFSASDDALDEMVDRLIIRLESSSSLGIMQFDISADGRLLSVLPTSEEEYTIELFRQRSFGSQSTLSHIGRFSQNQLQNMKDGQTPAQIRSSHLFALKTDSPPVLALRFLSLSDQQNAITEIFGNALRTRLRNHIFLRLKNSLELNIPHQFLLAADQAVIRQALVANGVTAFLNCLMLYQDNQLQFICQVVTQFPENDTVISLRTPLTTEIALMMQFYADPAANEKNVAVARVPLGADALAIAAIDADSKEGDEIAVLYPSELQIFKLDGRQFSLLKSVPLDVLEHSIHPTRVPTAHLFTADKNDDGAKELFGASNTLLSGFVIYPALGFQVEHTLFQPLAVVNKNDRAQFYSTDYYPGEDTFGSRTNVINYFGSTLERISIPAMRNLFSLDTEGNRFILWTDDRAVKLFETINGVSALVNFKYTILNALTTAPDEYPDTLFFCTDDNATGGQFQSGDAVHIVSIEQDGVKERGSIPTQLDINNLTVYNSGGTSPDYIVVMGRDNSGSMYFEMFKMPDEWRRGE